MGKFKSVELYDTFIIDHPVTGETMRVQAMEGNNVISCRECLFRQKEFKKLIMDEIKEKDKDFYDKWCNTQG